MSTYEQPDKAEVVRFLLYQEGRVMLCLDATHKGVEVPRRYAADPGLRLVLNIKMPQPIDIGPTAIESDLRFGGIPHYCIIPYEALWGAFNPDSGHGVFWPESMPEVIRQNYQTNPSLPAKNFSLIKGGNTGKPSEQDEPMGRTTRKTSSSPQEEETAKANKPQLKIVDGGAEHNDALPPPPASSPVAGKVAGKPFLRIVK